MKRQIGIFFLFIGLIVAIVAVISFQVKTPSAPACLIGMILVGFGFFLIWRDRPEVPASERFKTVRKLKEKKK
jgi:hypothetical protein